MTSHKQREKENYNWTRRWGKKGFLSCSSLPAGCSTSVYGDTIQQDIKSIVYFSIIIFFFSVRFWIFKIHDIQFEREIPRLFCCCCSCQLNSALRGLKFNRRKKSCCRFGLFWSWSAKRIFIQFRSSMKLFIVCIGVYLLFILNFGLLFDIYGNILRWKENFVSNFALNFEASFELNFKAFEQKLIFWLFL